MSVITLTSDYGANTYYAAALKARLISLLPDVSIVDISHQLPPYDLIQAAFLLQSCMDDFRMPVVHLIAIDTNLALYRDILLARKGNQWLIAADNGFLAMLGESWDEVLVVNRSFFNADDLSPEKNIFSRLAFNLITNVPVAEFASAGTPAVVVDSLRPVVEFNQIRTTIVHVDGYDNAITNLSRKQFEEWIGEARYRVYYRRKEFLEEIISNYAGVSQGTGVAVFNDKGWLEIAINRGQGKSLLGLKLGDQVIIEKQV